MTLKKFLLTLVISVTALLVVIIFAPSFVDWNQYRGELTTLAKSIVGRELAIKGDVKIKILPTPVISVNDVHLANVEGATDEFKTYMVTWSQNELQAEVIVDESGSSVYTMTHEDEQNGSPFWPFDQDFHIILNLAIGGSWGGICEIDNSSFPQKMKVDFVRVYKSINE